MDQDPSINTPKLPGPIRLFRDAWSLYKQQFTIFALLAVIPTILTRVSILLVPIILREAHSVNEFMLTPTYLFLVGGILIPWFSLPILYVIKHKDQQFSIREAYLCSLSHLFPFLVMTIITHLIFIGGLILFIIPGILFIFWCYFTSMTFVFDDDRGFNTVIKSREYMKGNMFSIIWRMSVIGVISAIITIIGSLPLTLLITVFAMLTVFISTAINLDKQILNQLIVGFSLLENLLSTIISSLVFPFGPLTLYLLFCHLKKNKPVVTLNSKRSYVVFALIGLVFIISISSIGLLLITKSI